MHVTFDFDGVICDSFITMINAHNYVKKYRFNTLPFVTEDSRYFDSTINHFQLKLENYLSSKDISEYFKLVNTFYLNNLQELTVFTDLLKLFRTDNSIKFSIVSSNIEEAILEVLTNNKIPHNRFEVILGKQTGMSKIELLDNTKNLNKEKLFYIGDTYEDEIICKQLDIKFGLAEYGYTQVREIRKKSVYKTFETPIEVYNFINNV